MKTYVLASPSNGNRVVVLRAWIARIAGSLREACREGAEPAEVERYLDDLHALSISLSKQYSQEYTGGESA